MADPIGYFLGLENVFWLTFLPVIGTMSGVLFAFYKYLKSQKENRKFKTVEQIEHYEDQLFQLYDDYAESNKTYDDCYKYARHMLIVLDRLSSLYLKHLISDDVMEYFQFWFIDGEVLLQWIESMERKGKNPYPSFCKIKEKFKAKEYMYELDAHFHKYMKKKLENSNYNPYEDTKEIVK